ncbi:hypothetical protein L9F63_021258 [Diploptera punctata]|uniref:Uncharacterized protein n=1 Tax=Diploptera punctata TaxID=6984 RepID=A0AAD7ZPU9_DIPPU|nr:hypothetical protein L9F63_021258 [Diploptera punctata]
MNYFTNQELDQNIARKCNRSYECFGWRLPDLLTDVIHPPICARDFIKKGKFDGGNSFEKSKLISDESLRSGSHLDRGNSNSNIVGFVNENINKIQQIEEENKIQSESVRINRPITIAKHETQDKIIASKDELIAHIKSDLPNCEKLKEILQNKTTSNSSSKITFSPSNNINKRQNIGLCKESKNVLCDCEMKKLVHTAEHEDIDIDLEESRTTFLKAISGLNSRLIALEMNNQQLRNDISNIQRELQMQEDTVTRMTEEARRLVSDLKNLRYLDDLIFLLQGQLDRISLQNWPFLLAHVLPQKDSEHELNLVV